jgi:hypothetical protein
MMFTELQDLIKSYGVITGMTQRMPMTFNLHGIKAEHAIAVTLLMPEGKWSTDHREIRSELYLQAESIIEIIQKEHQVSDAHISISDGSGNITGTLDINFIAMSSLYGELARSGCTGPDC